MKKLILVLALILVASPAFAALSLTLTQVGTTNVYDLGYTGADSANLPRAFALNIAVVGGAKISAITATKTGESVAPSNLGFGIFPGSIVIDSNGVVTNPGSPIAPVGDPGAGSALPAASAVVELGSLYVGDGNKPATSGTLCSLTIACSGATVNQTINVTEEDAYRGGIVLTNGTMPSPALTATATYTGCVIVVNDCLRQAGVPTAEWTAWNTFGKPDCWCYKRQCRGDSDNVKTGVAWVALSDLNKLKSAYNKTDTVLLTIPNGICADFDHIKTGVARVALPDLNILKTYYNKTETITKCCDVNMDCILTQPEKWNSWKP